eukprot:2923966-Alexandrium_andersonii.AAC.1
MSGSTPNCKAGTRFRHPPEFRPLEGMDPEERPSIVQVLEGSPDTTSTRLFNLLARSEDQPSR